SSTSIEPDAVITGEEAWSATWSPKSRPSAITDRARSRSVTNPTGRSSLTITTEPTLRSRISSAISRTVRSGAAVTTDSVITSRTSTRASLQSRAVVHLTLKRRIEDLIRLAAPALDLVLYAGDKVSR